MSEASSRQIGDISRSHSAAGRPAISAFLAFYAAVVVIQGGHVIEHIIQLVQVSVLGIPDDEALGLLGYIFAFQGTEEWLHIVFNVLYWACLLVIAWRLLSERSSVVPRLALWTFLFFGVWLEGWHVIEHVVIISNVIANNGCPCPGILDSQLGVSDTVLHFGYNAIAYTATVLPFAYLVRQVRAAKPHGGRHSDSQTSVRAPGAHDDTRSPAPSRHVRGRRP
jgi:hypothetical protein